MNQLRSQNGHVSLRMTIYRVRCQSYGPELTSLAHHRIFIHTYIPTRYVTHEDIGVEARGQASGVLMRCFRGLNSLQSIRDK